MEDSGRIAVQGKGAIHVVPDVTRLEISIERVFDNYAKAYNQAKDNSSWMVKILEYNKKAGKLATISKTEAFRQFLCNNSKKSLKCVPCEKYPTNGWMMSPEGLCFVEVKSDAFVIAKTFISWNLLRKDQIVTMNEIGQEALAKGFELNIPWEIFSEEDLKY
jgi:hypothetical protein